jgi:nucleoside phosphorylase
MVKPFGFPEMKQISVLIIIPLSEECNYFRETIKDRVGWTAPKTSRNPMIYRYNKDGRSAIVEVRTIEKMGHLEAVLALNAGVWSASPELVIVVGIAGSMQPVEVGIGDVVVSNQVKTYHPNKVGTISTDPTETPYYRFFQVPPIENVDGCVVVDERDRAMQSSYYRYERSFVECRYVNTALSKLEEEITSDQLGKVDIDLIPKKFRDYASAKRTERQIHYGWIYGSNHVIDSTEYRKYINEKNDDTKYDIYTQLHETGQASWKEGPLLAVDMESYGVLKAAEQMRALPPGEGGSRTLVGAVAVRGISDLAEGKGATDRGSKQQLRKIAVFNATEVTAQIIERLDYASIVAR